MFRQFIIAFCVFVAGACMAADDYLHPPTQVTLPATIGEFVRGALKDFESVQPGYGVGVPYEWPEAYRATLFIYTAGLQDLEMDIMSPEVISERELSAKVLLLEARSRQPSALSAMSRKTFSVTMQAPTTPSKTPVYWDQFIVYQGGQATNDSLFMWVAKGHIWKARVTRIPSHTNVNSNPFKFVTELVQRSIGD